MELQEHFECRNEILEGNVKCIDDTINAACDAHDDVFYLRNQIAEIFNEGISPKLNADGSDVLVILIIMLMIDSNSSVHSYTHLNSIISQFQLSLKSSQLLLTSLSLSNLSG